MAHRIAATVLGALCIGLAGCGDGSLLSNDPNSPEQGSRGSFGVTDVNVHGRMVTCVTWKLAYAGGLSCDWGAK